jgi:hypothetical protein
MKSFFSKATVFNSVFFILLVGMTLTLQGVLMASTHADDISRTKCSGCPVECPVICTQQSPVSASCDPHGYIQRTGGSEGAEMGISVGTAGDVNGDCYADVIIGSYKYDNSDPTTLKEGRVLVYYGSANGIDFSDTPWTAEGNSSNSKFGFSCGTAGDIDCDGYDDIVVGAYREIINGVKLGRVAVYFGASDGLKDEPDWEFFGEHNGSGIGYSVASAGDVNGDGVDDLVVGAPTFYNENQYFEGKAYVFFGGEGFKNKTAADWEFESNQAWARLGNSVAAADVNGDQKNDIIIGAYLYGDLDRGRVFVFHGDSNFQCKTSADWGKSGLSHYELGHCVAKAGDVNSDGYDDIIIGAPNAKINNLLHVGIAYVYYGSENGLATYEDYPWVIQGVEENGELGYSVGSAGKINHDGTVEYDDIFIGVPGYWTHEQGGVFLFHGSETGIVGSYNSPACILTGPQTHSAFGKSGCLAGDVNNDGCDDLIFGAPSVSSGYYSDCGFVRLYYGYKVNGCPYLLPQQ